MDSNHLTAFLAVAKTCSFSQAAETLHLTQPAVSKRISSLENLLGQRLFDRIGRHVNLTEAGRALLPRAHNILGAIEDTRRHLANLDGQVSGRLTLATSHHIGLHRLPEILRRFHQRHPEVTLDIQFVDSEVAYGKVLAGDVELGIITLSPEYHDQIYSQLVWPDPLVFVCAPDHPLAQQAQLELKDLSGFDAIFPGTGTFTHHIVKGLFSQQQVELRIGMSTNYMETIKMMVAIGLGWSILPATMVDASLTQLKLPAPLITRQLGFIHHRERTLSNAARALVELLDQQAAAAPEYS